MPDFFGLILVFLIGVAAAVVGAMVGGGSLLSIPVLILIGLPPHVAIATDRFAGLGAAVTAAIKFWKAKKIVWKLVPLLAVLSLAGAIIGAQILVSIETEAVQYAVGIIIIALLPFVFMKKNIGLQAQEVSTTQFLVGSILYLLIQILAGFFGGGTGTLIFYVLMLFFGVTIIQVAATQVIPFFILTVASIAIFATNDIIDYKLGLFLMAGTAVGGYLGAHIALRIGNTWVRRVFALIVVVVAVKLLFL
jgi:uncharacterized membrane protein YfcA